MTTLYKPVLIETAEQAEALPTGTLARHSEGAGMDHAHKIAAMPGLMGSHWVSSMGVESNAAMVGWTALVPIEAEEEWALIYDGEEPTPCADEADAREWARIDGEEQAPSRRYTTVWEETP